MSYTELEHGYQGLRKTRPAFYGGEESSDLIRGVKSNNSDGEEEDGGKQVVVGICAMAKKSESKPMREILTRLQEFQYIRILVFPEDVIVQKPVEEWPSCDCLISFHSKGFPLEKAIQYATLRHPYVINNLHMQYDIQDRRKVYSILESQGIEIPRYAVLDRDSTDPKNHELIESEDHVEVNGVVFNKPFVEKPVSAEDHNIYIYYPTSAGGGSQRLFRKIGSRSSVYSPESRVRKTGSFIYEDFMPTDGTDVKVYTVGPDYAHAEARKSPALDGKVERDSEGKEIRYPVILSNAEKLISRKVCLAFKQTVCGFDLLRANGKSFVCDVNGFSFVKNSNKYYDDCAKILGNMILRELAPTLHIPWSVPFQLDDPPIVPTTFGKMMELRCVVAVIRHGDRTPKQKMKVEVRHPKFFEIFEKYGGQVNGHVKLKRPKQLQEVLDIARFLLNEIELRGIPELAEKQAKLEQLKSVLEMYGHFSGINRKVQMKYQPKGRPKSSSSDDGENQNGPREPSLVLIVKWGGELTPAGRIQAEELGRIFRCMYPGGQGRHYTGEYAGTQGLGLLRLHSTYRHDLKIYASDEGRVQMTAAAFAKGLLALEGELTPILVQMVKSANTNGLLDNDYDASKHQDVAKTRLHMLMQQDRTFTPEDRATINPCSSVSIDLALDFVKNPVKCCEKVHTLIQRLMSIVRLKRDDPKTKDAILYHGENWELMGRRWGKIEKDFCLKNNTFDISKIPDIYDCIKYDLQHNQHTLQFDNAEELYINSKYLADIVIPQEYGMTMNEKLMISQGICTPLLKKIKADLQRNIEEAGEENVNRLNPRYSHGVSSPGRHVRTRLYFTSESHLHSLLTVLRYGGLIENAKDEQWRRAMEYVSTVSEINYMSQIVILLYEDPTKDPCSEERFHVELHFSPGVNCCVQKNLPPGPGFRPHSRNDHPTNKGNHLSSEPASSADNSPCDSPGPSSPMVMRKQTPTIVQVSEPIPIKQASHSEDRDEKRSLKSRPLMVSPSAQETRSRSFEQSRQPVVPDTTVGCKVSELRREAWGGSRSLSLPSAAEEEKVRSRRCVGGEKKRRIAMVESDSLLTGLDLAHVSIVVVGGGGARRSTGAAIGGMVVASTNGADIIGREDGGGGPVKVLPFCSDNSVHMNKYEWQQKQEHKRQQQQQQSNSKHENLLLRPSRLSLPTPSPLLIGATIQTDRRQRHSISGLRPHHAYLHKPSASSTTSSVFSTAVISGAASAPNLTDIISNTASVSEGCGGVPPIRPLETLHNALSLKQLDTFLERVSRNMKTPVSSPPKVPSSPRPSSPTGTGWSDPPSFVSSSGASSPTPLPEFFLAQRLASNTNSNYYSHRDSIEVAEFYSRSVDNTHFAPIVVEDGESGEVTPVSGGSEEDMCSETLLHEADTTVIPTDTPRLRLADICWDTPQEGSRAEGPECPDKNVNTPTPTPSRFVCTSVNEPVQQEPALTLATSSAESTSVGFHVAPPTVE